MFYHICFAVPDIERAMADLGVAGNVEWSPVLDDHLGEWDYRLVFSRGGAPYIELVQGPEGSPWDASGGAYCHHLGYWTRDVAESSARLTANGLDLSFSACSLGRPYSYHEVPGIGVQVELMDISRQTRFLGAWDPEGARLPAFDA